jgi:capsular polysaccharide biosynthesis protein
MPKAYTATTYVLFSGNDFQQAVAGGYTPASPLTQEATATALLTPQIEAQAAAAAGLRSSAYYAVNISTTSNSSLINVTGSTRAPRSAAALADAAAAQIIAVIKRSNENELQGARATVRSQLAAAKRSRKLALAGELNSFATLEALANQSLQIVQRAAIPSAPSGPGKTRAAAIALVLGLILGTGIALLRHDQRSADSA